MIFNYFNTVHIMTADQIAHVLTQGGNCQINAQKFTADQLNFLAQRARLNNAQLIITDAQYITSSALPYIALQGKGHITFQFN